MKNEIANTTTTHPLTLVEAAAPSVGSSGNDNPKSKRDQGSLDPGQNDGTFSFRSLFTVICNLLLQVSKLKDVIKGLESKVEDLTKENARLKEKAQEPEKNPDNPSQRYNKIFKHISLLPCQLTNGFIGMASVRRAMFFK
jgi:hypothetical protein